jgi:hypothetical protein
MATTGRINMAHYRVDTTAYQIDWKYKLTHVDLMKFVGDQSRYQNGTKGWARDWIDSPSGRLGGMMPCAWGCFNISHRRIYDRD